MIVKQYYTEFLIKKKEKKKGLSSMMAILQSFSTNLVVDQRT